jgi:hypothetical protein
MEREHEQKRYNGWTNFQTWAVNLWLDNEASSCRYWRAVAARCCHEGSDSTPVCDGDCTVNEAAAFMVAESLRREITAASPLSRDNHLITRPHGSLRRGETLGEDGPIGRHGWRERLSLAADQRPWPRRAGIETPW